MKTQLKKIAVGLMAAVACSTLMSQKASAQAYDQVVSVSWMREGVAPYSNDNGVGAAVTSGTIWNDIAADPVGAGFVGEQLFSSLVDSNGNASTLEFTNDWGFMSSKAGAGNKLMRGYYYEGQHIGGSPDKTYSIDGLEIDTTYDVFFYLGNDPEGTYGGTNLGITVTADGGVVSSVSANGSGYTPGSDLGTGSPTHADWVEGVHYEKLRVATTATTVSGTFTLADTGGDSDDADNRFFGIQIARIIPLDLPGDFNDDTVIDSIDAGILRDNMNAHLDAGFPEDSLDRYALGDIDFSGTVDLNDFHEFLEVFPGAAAAATGVPEPSSVALSLVGFALLAGRRRK